MHSLNNRGVHSENLRIFPNCDPNTMDYRQKMVVPSSQKLKHEDDDDEDLETLRLAALKSLRAKHTLHSTRQPTLLPQQVKPRLGYPSCPIYNHQRQAKSGYYQNRPPRQNGNTYCPSRVNQNLIEIVPVEEEEIPESNVIETDSKIIKTDIQEDERGDSKFYRYKDNASGSEEEDGKESTNAPTVILTPIKSEPVEKCRSDESGTEKECHTEIDKSPSEAAFNEDVCEKIAQEKCEAKEEEEEDAEEDEDDEEDEEEEEEEEEEEKSANDDDDDVLLMADLEEEDSLERLMDEMEREMNVDKFEDAKENVTVKKESKESRKNNDMPKVRTRKSRIERKTERNGPSTGQISSSSSISATKNERRSVSPRPAMRQSQKRRSLSPKPRSRKKSPRRSPRRSPSRLLKKSSFRDAPRMRSPRKLSSPPSSRFSPRPRSPRLSPRGRSPNNRSPVMRRCSPPRKLSPRGRSPHSRSPRNRRSRSPGLITRSRSPQSRLARSPKRSIRSRSPRIIRSRSPKARTPRSKSPRISPLRTNSPRCRSPRLSPRRLINSPRSRSPKLSSPERRRGSPLHLRSPLRHSPHKSPWSSPRNSPRLSPRRRKSPAKESTRKPRQRSMTPVDTPSAAHKRESSPLRKNAPSSPDVVRTKGKHKDSAISTNAGLNLRVDLTNDPIFEARRRKFENTKPIDPIHDNKKIKLSKKDSASKPTNKIIEEDHDDVPETDLCQSDDYVYEVIEDVVSEASSADNTVSVCVEMVPMKVEKERSKKKKKRDKVLYQVGKLKGELPLSERIGKEKKCKKRTDRAPSPVEGSPERETVVEDLTTNDEEEADLRTELSRRRAERLNRAAPIQSARLLQSAFKGVVNEVAKTNAKVIKRHATKGDDIKNNKKEVRRVTVLHRTVTDVPDSDDEATVDSKVPVRFRLGVNKPTLENSRESKAARKSSKRQGRKVKHKNNMSLADQERKN